MSSGGGDLCSNSLLEPNRSQMLSGQFKLHNLSNTLFTQVQIGNLLSHRYEKLLQAEKFTDCTFHINSNQLKSHKIILAAASPVFEAMFFGPLKETSSDIDILDMSLENFEVLIRFIYTGKVDFQKMSLQDCIELYYGAEKYLLNELIDECLFVISQKLRFSNILAALELSFCMNLSRLLEICMDFFTKCCLSDSQFISFLKKNYCHIPKDCLKQIIATNKEFELPNLLWFVMEWCQQECEEMGVEKSNAFQKFKEDLQLPEHMEYYAQSYSKDPLTLKKDLLESEKHIIIERSYYKACRPITIDWDNNEWKIQFKCDRFVSLTGILLHSRLPPSSSTSWGSSLDYEENLMLEIKALENDFQRNAANEERDLNDLNQRLALENGNDSRWFYAVNKQVTKYNSNLLIKWQKGLVLSPDFIYELKISWPSESYSAEYPCSLMAANVDGFQFHDSIQTGVSLLKGLRLINLV